MHNENWLTSSLEAFDRVLEDSPRSLHDPGRGATFRAFGD